MLAVVGGKGGVGTTTTTLGVALALGRSGREAVAVDADRDAPNLARTAGVGRHRSVREDVIEESEGGATGDDRSPVEAFAAGAASLDGASVVHPDCPRVAVVPGGRAPESVYRAAFARMAADDRRVIVDCPAGAGRDVALPLRFAERALVVSTPRPAALRDATKTAAMADALDATLAGVVLTRCRSVPRGIEKLFDGVPVTGIPATDGAHATSPIDGYSRVVRRSVRHNG